MSNRYKLGNNVRMSFAKINEVLDMPNLIEVQKNSYEWFLKEGLKEVFSDVSSITDYTGNLVLEFIDYRLDESTEIYRRAVQGAGRDLCRPAAGAGPAAEQGNRRNQGVRRCSWGISP